MSKHARLLAPSLALLWALGLALAGPAQARTPNDPYFSYQWHLSQVGAEEAWETTMGVPRVKVAVVDTGVAYEDYEGGILVSDLARTVFDRENALNVLTGDSHPTDDNGHGTHITGTIAQSTDNALGAAGLAPGVTILPVKAFTAGYASAEDVAEAIDHAVSSGAHVINISAGGSDTQLVREACQRAYEAGVLVVAAAGNSAREGLDYPAAYATVLAVGAVGLDASLATYSNHALDMVVAPGGDTYQDLNHDGYGDGVLQQDNIGDFVFKDGTSMATPHVSAVAALILSAAWEMGANVPAGPARIAWLKNIISATTLDLGERGQDTVYGWGLVQAETALAYLHSAQFAAGAVAAASSLDPLVDADADSQAEATSSAPVSSLGQAYLYSAYETAEAADPPDSQRLLPTGQ